MKNTSQESISNPTVLVSVLNWNRRDDLKQTLETLLRQTYEPKELLVIDNGSTDGSLERLKTHFPSVKTIFLPKNIGVSARNKAFQNTKVDYIFQFDNDSAPKNPDYIKKAVDFLEKYPHIDAICPRVYYTYTKASETKNWEQYAIDGNEKEGYKGLFIHASGMIFKRERFLLSDGYTDEFLIHGEEVDLSLNFLKHGLTIVYKPNLEAIHRHSLQQRQPNEKIESVVKHWVWILWKYFPNAYAISLTFKWFLASSLIFHQQLFPCWKGFFKGLFTLPKHLLHRQLFTAEQIKKTKSWQKMWQRGL